MLDSSGVALGLASWSKALREQDPVSSYAVGQSPAGPRPDYKTLPASSKAMIYLAMTDLTARRLTGESSRPQVPGVIHTAHEGTVLAIS